MGLPIKSRVCDRVQDPKVSTLNYFFLQVYVTLLPFLLSSASSMVVPNSSANSLRDGGPRRSLNLEDYKKRRGLI